MENSSSRKIDNTSDYIVQEVYKNNQNYIVKETNKKSKVCVIFFSGHGLYFPNEEAEFIDKIVKKNRYEWENISNDRVFKKKCGKIIFVRDVHKQWYVEGINEECNSVDKTVQLLKSLTEGYKIITVGNSAGGYAAVLFGCKLNADKIFSISGQFFLSNTLSGKLISKHKNQEEYSRYYDLRNLIKNYSGKIFYLFPCKSEIDIQQCKHIEDIKNLIKIRITAQQHGIGLLPENYKYVFFENSEKLIEKIGQEKEFTQYELYKITVPGNIKFFSLIKKIAKFQKMKKRFLLVKNIKKC